VHPPSGGLPTVARANASQAGEKVGAGDGDRTRDIELGKLAFYR
jgi:hypothetical protein